MKKIRERLCPAPADAGRLTEMFRFFGSCAFHIPLEYGRRKQNQKNVTFDRTRCAGLRPNLSLSRMEAQRARFGSRRVKTAGMERQGFLRQYLRRRNPKS